MRILVICGAGASSTFVAQRVRRAALDQGVDLTAVAGTDQTFAADLADTDVVLVGPHLGHALERIRADAEATGAVVVLLPPDIFSDMDGTRTLELVRHASPARITHAD